VFILFFSFALSMFLHKLQRFYSIYIFDVIFFSIIIFLHWIDTCGPWSHNGSPPTHAPHTTPSLLCLQIVHVDGHKVKLANSGVTKPGEVRVVKGEGMPVYEGVSAGAAGAP
jgi:hypothetical protein